MRRRASTPGARLESRGWRRVFQSDVGINNGRGTLEALGCNERLASVMRRVRSIYADDGRLAEFEQNESMGRAVIKTSDYVSQIIALDTGQQGGTVVFVLTQSHDNYIQSLSPPRRRAMRDIPPYPGSTVETYVQVEDRHAQLEISSAPVRPEAVHAFYQSSLAIDGWTEAMPRHGRSAGHSGIALFQKGLEICGVLVQADGAESVITVLHKRMSVE